MSITNCQATSIESKGVPSAIADFVHQARMKAFEGGPLLNRYFINDYSEISGFEWDESKMCMLQLIFCFS